MTLGNILIVDDKPAYIKDVLMSYGYDVTIANSGNGAMNMLNHLHSNLDLILLDIVMPNMSGWELLKNIRSNKVYDKIPIIMLTAVDSEQKQVSCLKIGADDYITKPFSLPNLLARIEAILRRSKKSVSQFLDISFDNHYIDKKSIESLTKREKEVLRLVAHGANNKEISEHLVVREVTVKTHLNNIFKKLNVTNRTQAVLLAIKLDLGL